MWDNRPITRKSIELPHKAHVRSGRRKIDEVPVEHMPRRRGCRRGSPNLASVMHLHHWLAWLAVNLAILLLGVGMSQPPPEPVAMAAFDDAYTEPRKSQTKRINMRADGSRIRAVPVRRATASG